MSVMALYRHKGNLWKMWNVTSLPWHVGAFMARLCYHEVVTGHTLWPFVMEFQLARELQYLTQWRLTSGCLKVPLSMLHTRWHANNRLHMQSRIQLHTYKLIDARPCRLFRSSMAHLQEVWINKLLITLCVQWGLIKKTVLLSSDRKLIRVKVCKLAIVKWW